MLNPMKRTEGETDTRDTQTHKETHMTDGHIDTHERHTDRRGTHVADETDPERQTHVTDETQRDTRDRRDRHTDT